ncbi:MAG: type II toxin-antitoxin system RelB/DinJ family antitoxin [Lachnospiraceae bacterium]|jgi:addiction module RelB/DinJ family antitoxin|nr:type II toxin-antitoxin system RelB/DinJ family antitoxin [Lachnospiraceae bacterium]
MENKLIITELINDTDMEKVEATLSDMGLDVDTAVRMFLKRIAVSNRFPFDINTDNCGIRRKVDQLCRVTVPREFLESLGVRPGEYLEAFTSGDSIYYKKAKSNKDAR